MSQSGGDALHPTVVECYHAAVTERQLNLALTLLACNLSSHGAVNLIGEPVLAGYGLQLEDAL